MNDVNEICFYFLSLVGELRKAVKKEKLDYALIRDTLSDIAVMVMKMDEWEDSDKKRALEYMEEVRGIVRQVLMESEYQTEVDDCQMVIRKNDHSPCRLSDATLSRYAVEEYRQVAAVASKPIRKILYIGSGPYPISAISMVRGTNEITRIDLLDKEKDASDQGERLVQICGMGDRLVTLPSRDVTSFKAVKEYDLLILAAMVGIDRAEKMKILEYLYQKMIPGQLLLVRDSEEGSLRSLFYEPVPENLLAGKWETLAKFGGQETIISSKIVKRLN